MEEIVNRLLTTKFHPQGAEPPFPPVITNITGPQTQTAEQVLEDIQEATNQYLSCTDPTEAAARRRRVIEGEASGEVEETVAAIMASSSLPVVQQSHNEEIMGNDPSEAMNEAHNQDTRSRIEEKGRETPRRRRMQPATTRSSAGNPNILRGASSKKRNLSSLRNLPARRSSAVQNRNYSTKAAIEGASWTSNPVIQLIPAMTREKEDFRAAPHPAP